MQYTVIILGATGLTGKTLLQKLLASSQIKEVKHFGRRSVGFEHEKLSEYITNLQFIMEYADKFTADVVYCCIGTTSSKTKTYREYEQVDKDIPVNVAKLCERNKVKKLLVISSMGANENSVFEYPRIKGEMQNEVLSYSIPEIYILQPSIIGGKREEARLAESAGKLVMAIVDPLMKGPLRKFKMIEPEEIANAMLQLSFAAYEKQLISSDEIYQLNKLYHQQRKT